MPTNFGILPHTCHATPIRKWKQGNDLRFGFDAPKPLSLAINTNNAGRKTKSKSGRSIGTNFVFIYSDSISLAARY